LPPPQPARELVAAGWRLIQAGDFAAALAPLREACALDPLDAAAQFLRGACHHALRQPDDALAAFDAALQLDPAHRDASLGAISVLCQLGRADEALHRCVHLAAAAPDDPDLRFTTGVVQETRGDLSAALACYDAALSRAPAHRPSLLNRGLVLTRLGRLEDAYANNLTAAKAFPTEPDSHFNLAEVCLTRSHYEEARRHCDRALDLAPRHVGALFDRALALAALGQIEDADAAFATARATDPDGVRALEVRAGGESARTTTARDVYLARGFEALIACDWSQRSAYHRRFSDWIDSPVAAPWEGLSACFQAVAAGIAPERQRKLAEAISRGVAQGVVQVAAASPPRNSRLRIGYLSPDFREHAVGYLVQRLLEAHDRAAFEVFAYSLCRDDGSNVRKRVASGVDVFRDITQSSTDEAAQQIRADGIAVLVDLAGYTTGARPELLARRPAPVAMAYLGFPGTTGAAFMDYFVADAVTVPHGEDALFSERLVRLPRTFWVHDAPADLPPVPPRTALGLPENAVVLCAFHNGYKIAPECFDAWMELLRASPGAVLWLLDGGNAMRANLLREAVARGVAADRLRFAPRAPRSANLARLGAADLFLDAFHYNAGANALDALWAGLPVITRRGAAFAGRMAASAVLATGLRELVVDTRAAYVTRAQELVADGRERASLRARLLDGRASAPLFDVAGRARELERAYRIAADGAWRGIPPSALDLGDL
jgi:tetratricopeptide (TPR) repeat protein